MPAADDRPTSGIPDRLMATVHRDVSRRDALRFGALGVGGASLASLLAACGSGGGGGSNSQSSGAAGGKPASGGDLVIARAQDAVSMDKTMVFSNASIWVFHQIFETLTVSSKDGKTVS